MAGENPTVAALVAKFTEAEITPGTARKARSIVATQEAQEIPLTGIVTCSTTGRYPASAMAWTSAAGSAAAGSNRTVPRSVARFTVACRTPATPRSAVSTAATQEAQLIP